MEKPQLEHNLERVREVLRNYPRIAVVDQRDGRRYDYVDFYATPNGLVVLHRVVDDTMLITFNVLREMGTDNKMDTLLAEIAAMGERR